MGSVVCDVFVVDEDAAGGGADEGVDGAEEGGFAGAAAAEEGGGGVGGEREVDVVEELSGGVAAGDRDGDVEGFELDALGGHCGVSVEGLCLSSVRGGAGTHLGVSWDLI